MVQVINLLITINYMYHLRNDVSSIGTDTPTVFMTSGLRIWGDVFYFLVCVCF